MQTVTKIILILLAVYSLLAAFIPDIRFIYWQGTSSKLAGISHFGVSWFFWVLVVVVCGLIEIHHPLMWYFLALFGLLIAVVGYVIDSV